MAVLRHSFRWMAIIIILITFVALLPVWPVEAQNPGVPPCRPYDPKVEDPPFCAGDMRVNPFDPVARMTAYCQTDHSLSVFAVVNSQGRFLYNISAVRIASTLASAQRSGRHVLMEERPGWQTWALNDGQIQLHDYSTPG